MYKVSYTGDGITSEFVFAFPFFQEADIKVAVNQELLEPKQYSVNINEEFDGGIVTLPLPLEIGAQIDIFRQIDLSRIVDYQPTAKIDPEDLNTDFNFLLEAFKDLRAIDIDLVEWKNVHDNVLAQVLYTRNLIEGKLTGGAVLGVYNNLLNVLENALPELINDYGSITEPAPNENKDDYGVL